MVGIVDWSGLGKGLVNAVETGAHNLRVGLVNTVNRAGEVVYDANQHVNNFFNNLVGMPPPDRWAAYPGYVRTHSDVQGQLGNYKPETLPKQMPDYIEGYRADPTGKFGGTDHLETMPTKLGAASLYAYTRALAEAQKYGAPQLTAQQLAALTLKEGLESYGALRVDTNHPSQVWSKLTDQGIPDYIAQFPALVAEKTATANRLHIPFAAAWQGTGHSYTGSGTTGADYARNYDKYFVPAASNPKNRALVDFIQSALDAGKPKK